MDGGNAALKARTEEAHQQRAAGVPTVPSTMASELAANPFLRAPDVATFADLRAKKDKFPRETLLLRDQPVRPQGDGLRHHTRDR